MKTVTFLKALTIEEDERTTRTFPEGWTGEVEDDIAELAAEEGCIAGKAKSKAKKGKTDPVEPASLEPDPAAPPA